MVVPSPPRSHPSDAWVRRSDDGERARPVPRQVDRERTRSGVGVVGSAISTGSATSVGRFLQREQRGRSRPTIDGDAVDGVGREWPRPRHARDVRSPRLRRSPFGDRAARAADQVGVRRHVFGAGRFRHRHDRLALIGRVFEHERAWSGQPPRRSGDDASRCRRVRAVRRATRADGLPLVRPRPATTSWSRTYGGLRHDEGDHAHERVGQRVEPVALLQLDAARPPPDRARSG